MKEKKNFKKIFLQTLLYIFIIVSSVLTVLGLGYMQSVSTEEMIRNGIVILFAAFAVCTGLAVSIDKGGLLYTNAEHLGRFFVFYLLGIVFAILSLYLPAKVWPVLILAVALSLTSNAAVGMSAYITIILIIALATNGQAYVFYMNALVGVFAITMFKDIDYEFRYIGSLVASVIALFVCENAFFILFENKPVTLDIFVLPMINVAITTLFLLVLLKYYSKKIVHVYRDKYQEINDPEFAVLANLKKEDAKAYYHAIHTAYFCDKIARKIGADVYLAKALGYYGKIDILTESKEADGRSIAVRYKFPPDLRETYKQLSDKDSVMTRKEVAIAYLADAVVSSISYFFEKDKDAVLDYQHVIQLIFKKKLDSNLLYECDITLKELNSMKNLFIEENLYYDFLR